MLLQFLQETGAHIQVAEEATQTETHTEAPAIEAPTRALPVQEPPQATVEELTQALLVEQSTLKLSTGELTPARPTEAHTPTTELQTAEGPMQATPWVPMWAVSTEEPAQADPTQTLQIPIPGPVQQCA